MHTLKWLIAVSVVGLVSLTHSAAQPPKPVGTLFVAANGNDKNPGTQARPFQHIQRAVSTANPGDVICVDNGAYNEHITFKKSGNAAGWITLRPLNLVDVQQAKPLVTIAPRGGGHAIHLAGQSYIRIEGLEISGALWGIGGEGGNHTVVTNNLVHDTGASGIQLNKGDYRTITKNLVHDCAKMWKGNGSGISIYTPTAFDNAPGFHNVIAQNVAYNNSNPEGGSDGNGIIFDDGKHSHGDKLAYTPASLIENNLAYSNGGAGIHVFKSINVTVRNNTTYWNRQLNNKSTWRGDLSNMYSDDIVWVNNIGWANTGFNKYNTALNRHNGAARELEDVRALWEAPTRVALLLKGVSCCQ